MATRTRHADLETSGSAGPGTAQVRVVARTTGTHLLLEVSGEADLSTAPELRDELAAALSRCPRSVALEVSHLTYCDLAGLDALNDFCAEASRAGVPPVVRGMSPRLAWMNARFPTAHGMPASVESAAPEDEPTGRERWRPGGAPFGSARAAMGTTPRPWPER